MFAILRYVTDQLVDCREEDQAQRSISRQAPLILREAKMAEEQVDELIGVRRVFDRISISTLGSFNALPESEALNPPILNLTYIGASFHAWFIVSAINLVKCLVGKT